jgi:hypothetical protein
MSQGGEVCVSAEFMEMRMSIISTFRCLVSLLVNLLLLLLKTALGACLHAPWSVVKAVVDVLWPKVGGVALSVTRSVRVQQDEHD